MLPYINSETDQRPTVEEFFNFYGVEKESGGEGIMNAHMHGTPTLVENQKRIKPGQEWKLAELFDDVVEMLRGS